MDKSFIGDCYAPNILYITKGRVYDLALLVLEVQNGDIALRMATNEKVVIHTDG